MNKFLNLLLLSLLLLPLGQVMRRPQYPAEPTLGYTTGLILRLKANAGLYDATSGGSAVTSDGSSVARWEDQSGSGNHATQATSGSRPVLKLGVQNGWPGIRFDATDDGMACPANVVKPLTIFIVYNYKSSSSATRRALQGANQNWLLGPYDNQHQAFIGLFMGSPPSVTQDVFVLSEITQATSDTKWYINGTQISTSSVDFAPGTLQIAYGTGNPPYAEPLDGDILEILAYNSVLGTTDRQTVESYFRTKYAISGL